MTDKIEDTLRSLYTALILDVHTVQRRLTQALQSDEDVRSFFELRPVDHELARMEECIRRLDPLIDAVRELEHKETT